MCQGKKEVYNKEQDEAVNVQGVDDAPSAVTGMENGVEKGVAVLNPLRSSDVEQGAPTILSITLQNPRFSDDEAIEGLNDEFGKRTAVLLEIHLSDVRDSYKAVQSLIGEPVSFGDLINQAVGSKKRKAQNLLYIPPPPTKPDSGSSAA
ncbi:hypothetical protein L484_021954 [Morus notabilis]|uniref:Uncharacterized protein n=1 Tax=Morus notabilis TaxID=981085 RepID=W9R903_9ROSA|nr:hypothetical protein L484_021954 [Morus notabilis]